MFGLSSAVLQQIWLGRPALLPGLRLNPECGRHSVVVQLTAGQTAADRAGCIKASPPFLSAQTGPLEKCLATPARHSASILGVISLCLGDVQMSEWCRPRFGVSLQGLSLDWELAEIKRLKGGFEKKYR